MLKPFTNPLAILLAGAIAEIASCSRPWICFRNWRGASMRLDAPFLFFMANVVYRSEGTSLYRIKRSCRSVSPNHSASRCRLSIFRKRSYSDGRISATSFEHQLFASSNIEHRTHTIDHIVIIRYQSRRLWPYKSMTIPANAPAHEMF